MPRTGKCPETDCRWVFPGAGGMGDKAQMLDRYRAAFGGDGNVWN